MTDYGSVLKFKIDEPTRGQLSDVSATLLASEVDNPFELNLARHEARLALAVDVEYRICSGERTND